MRRHFNTGDGVTDHNLSRLDHLTTSTFAGGNASHVHDWLCAVIQTIQLLPPALATKMSETYYMIGDAHYRWSEAVRPVEWKRLADHLEVNLAKVAEEIGCDGKHGTASFDLSGRPKTLGERVEALCTKLMNEGLDTSEGARMLQELAMNSHPQLSSDLHELQRLAKLKRKPDDYRSKVIHCLYHMRIVAGDLYHCK